MTRLPLTSVLILAMVCIVLVSGCIYPLDKTNQTPASSPAVEQQPASYKVSIAQPDEGSKSITMDTDVYNLGEVVEFQVINKGSGTLTCLNDPPTFSVIFQTGSGRWATKMGTDAPIETNKTSVEPGKSSPVNRFVTTGWEPNRYRIVSDCGVFREFLLRPLPTPVPTICPQQGIEPVWVRINPISNPYAGTAFTISGTTNRAAGEELRYLVFPGGTLTKNLEQGEEKPLSTRVSEGVCGNNTWSVDAIEKTPQEYYIMISAGSLNATAMRRFTALPVPPP